MEFVYCGAENMLPISEVQRNITSGADLEKLSRLYCCGENAARGHAERYLHVLNGLQETYGAHETAALFSAPGRTEIGGNHTDHQHGCVLAGSVNIDMIAAVGRNDRNQIRLTSEGYAPYVIDLADLTKKPEEENTSYAILRGTCKAFADRGAELSGLDVYVASNVPKGSGVSSSAAFEVLIGTILNELFLGENKVTPVEIAQIGQWVENVYFGKPCGLMDQMASSVGGCVGIDFADPTHPIIRQAAFNLKKAGLTMCIVDSGADHADLTDEYAAVPAECKAVAKVCGGEVLREVSYETFLSKLPECRTECGDRAVLRAFHFYSDNRRAQQETEALEREDYASFLKLINISGDSSWEYLQNITPAGSIQQQAVGLTIALARESLDGEGAVRIHGGGFAGTVQCFVPEEKTAAFCEKMEAVLGKGSCHVMAIRPVGGARIL